MGLIYVPSIGTHLRAVSWLLWLHFPDVQAVDYETRGILNLQSGAGELFVPRGANTGSSESEVQSYISVGRTAWQDEFL